MPLLKQAPLSWLWMLVLGQTALDVPLHEQLPALPSTLTMQFSVEQRRVLDVPPPDVPPLDVPDVVLLPLTALSIASAISMPPATPPAATAAPVTTFLAVLPPFFFA